MRGADCTPICLWNSAAADRLNTQDGFCWHYGLPPICCCVNRNTSPLSRAQDQISCSWAIAPLLMATAAGLPYSAAAGQKPGRLRRESESRKWLPALFIETDDISLQTCSVFHSASGQSAAANGARRISRLRGQSTKLRSAGRYISRETAERVSFARDRAGVPLDSERAESVPLGECETTRHHRSLPKMRACCFAGFRGCKAGPLYSFLSFTVAEDPLAGRACAALSQIEAVCAFVRGQNHLAHAVPRAANQQPLTGRSADCPQG
jgi:hypothetical protein